MQITQPNSEKNTTPQNRKKRRREFSPIFHKCLFDFSFFLIVSSGGGENIHFIVENENPNP